MKPNIDSNFIHFPTPSDGSARGANGQAAVASGIGAVAPDHAETPSGGRAKRGRPTDYAPRVIDMLCESIRRHGLSDSAAAEQQGMSTSTLSRWKQLFPEIGIKLKQARQEIRSFHLQRIMDHAAADDAKGLRASMWILERLFPGDYSPRMKERNAYLNLEDRLADKEAHEALDEQLRELHAMQAEEREARAAAQAAQAAEAATAAEAPLTTDFTDFTDSKCGSGVTVPSVGVPPAAAVDSGRDGEAPNAAAVQENCASTFEGDSHNSRNSGEAEPVKEPGRPRPADPNRAAALSRTPNVDSAHEHPQENAAPPFGSTGRGRPGSLDEAALGRISCVYSETDSHNSRNSGEVEVQGGAL
jgi:hypothetical protein